MFNCGRKRLAIVNSLIVQIVSLITCIMCGLITKVVPVRRIDTKPGRTISLLGNHSDGSISPASLAPQCTDNATLDGIRRTRSCAFAGSRSSVA